MLTHSLTHWQYCGIVGLCVGGRVNQGNGDRIHCRIHERLTAVMGRQRGGCGGGCGGGCSSCGVG